MPFRVIWGIVRETCADGSVVVMRLRGGGPMGSSLHVVPADTIEEGYGCEHAGYADEVENEFPISPWDNRRDSVRRNCG